jgi:hypothetical protein
MILRQVVGAYPRYTLNPDSPNTLSSGQNQEVFRWIVTNSANPSEMDLNIDFNQFTFDITSGVDSSFAISNVRIFNAKNVSTALYEMTRGDGLDRPISADDNSTFYTDMDYSISSGTSETFFMVVDVEGFNLETDSLLVKFPDLGNIMYPSTSIEWSDETGMVFDWLYSNEIDFRSNRLSGF